MLYIEWLLWGFGAKIQEQFPSRITEEVSWDLYKKSNIGLFLKHPYDYMAWGSTAVAKMSYSGNKTGYFPTPMNVCIMMVEITMTEQDKTRVFNDPCVGTGSFLLPASNYSLRLTGQDISHEMIQMVTVNGYLYIPWLVVSGEGMIDWNDYDCDYQAIYKRLEECREQLKNLPLLLEHKPLTNKLTSWF